MPPPLAPSNHAPHTHPSMHLQPPSHPSSRSGTSTPTTGSATQTITSTTPRTSQSPEPVILRLRGSHNPSTIGASRRVVWAEDVVDNEGLGRKSSKVCCIYHAPKAAGESSDEESSSSDDDSADDGAAKPVGGKRKGRRKGHEKDCGHGHDGHEHIPGNGEVRKPSPNAYERVPKQRNPKS